MRRECRELLDKFYWDVVETQPSCVDSLVEKCNESSTLDDRLFCKSSIDLRCKPCVAFLRESSESIPPEHRCYNELLEMCRDPKHKSTKFCLGHGTKDDPPTDASDASDTTDKESWWDKFFCKCRYFDDVNVVAMRRIRTIILMLLLTTFIIVYFT